MSRVAGGLLLSLGLVALAGCSAADTSPVQTDHVSIPGQWVFEPATAQVAVGATVTWTNHGGQTHSVTFDDPSLGDRDVKPGESVTVTFPHAGTFAYHCKYHPPDMKGRIVVQ